MRASILFFKRDNFFEEKDWEIEEIGQTNHVCHCDRKKIFSIALNSII